MADNKLKKLQSKKKRFWEVHVRAWGRSGLSQNDYCKRNQLSSSQFCYWKKKLGQSCNAPLSFIPVAIGSKEQKATTTTSDSGLTIYLDSSVKIGLSNDFTPSTLVKVVAALEYRS